jgi:N-acetylglucosaminyl-diphospho-decaprenol L-rhamnosyltransferase
MARPQDVSVVVVNYNGEHYLPECLRAVVAAAPREILVVDSGSTDGSLALLTREFPSVRALPLGSNLGPAAARNAGLQAAAGELVLCVDNDVVLLPGCLEELQQALDADPTVAMVQARSLVAGDEATIHYDGADIHFLGLLRLRHWFVPVAAAGVPATVPVGAAIALCILVRRTPVQRVGGFFAELEILFEDTDLSLRLLLSGHQVLVAERALCRHKGGTKGLSRRGADDAYPERRTFLHSRNRWLVVLSCYRWRTLLVLWPALLLYGLVHLAFVAAEGHLGAWLRGKLALRRLLPVVHARRRQLAALRTRPDREVLTAGPLTYNPGLTRGGVRGAVRGALDAGFTLWWRLFRRLSG